jgi:imidazolonepropionase-like amidohydrolase
MSRRICLAAALAIAGPALAAAQASPGEGGNWLIRGGTVVTGTGERLANTSVLIRNGRIAQMGANVAAGDAKVIDAAGKFIYPGMIDANTPIGLVEIGGIQPMTMRNELGQFNPHLRALVALNVESEFLGVTRMNGVTSVLTSPAGGIISGQAAMINTAGWTWEDLAVTRSAGIVINLPGAAGAGGGRGGGGGGRGGAAPAPAPSATDLHAFMKAAQDYDAKRTAGSAKLDLIYESMRPLFRKEIPAIIPAGGEAGIRSAIEFGEQYGLKVVIMGGAQAYRARALLAQKNVPVILSSIQSVPQGNSPYDEIYAQPGLLHDAGVKFAFSTGGGANARHVPEHAALAVAYGLPLDAALKALTIWPAEIFGADKEIGSIAQGKMANLFVASGDPLDMRTQITHVFIKGRNVPSDDRHSRLYQKYRARPMPPPG